MEYNYLHYLIMNILFLIRCKHSGTCRCLHTLLCVCVSANANVMLQKGPPRYSEESVLQLERELVQARLKEAESQCALKEMQDKILDMEKVSGLRHQVLLRCHCMTSLYHPTPVAPVLIDHLPQRNSSLPDDTNVARLQEELIGVKLREAEALTGLKELRQQVRDLEDHWQVNTSMSAHETTRSTCY